MTTGTTPPMRDANQTLGWMHSAATFLSPFVLVALGAMFTWMGKIDDRQYSMKDEYLSKHDFNVAVSRLETAIDTKMVAIQSNVDARHTESSKQMTRILDEMGKLNNQLTGLAIDLEKKTK